MFRTMAAAPDTFRQDRTLLVLVLAAFAFGIALRIFLNLDRPFWSDEVFTGTLAMQRTPADLLPDMLGDTVGPVYFSFIWLWEKIAGPGDFALRLPSLLFSIAAPLLVLWKGHGDPRVRMTWAALIALSMPLIEHANDARYYSLLVLIASAQSIAFMKAVKRPTTRTAFIWTIGSAILVLTHYHTLPLIACQGLIYLWINGKQAIRTWPAGLVILLLPAWIVPNLAAVREWLPTGWQPLLKAADLAVIPNALFAFGFWISSLVAVGAAVIATVHLRLARTDDDRAAAAACLAAIVGCASIFAISLFVPNFHPRYLLPYIPSVLLGLGLLARHSPTVPAPLLLVFATLDLVSISQRSTAIAADMRWQLSWQRAAADVAAGGATTVIFYWNTHWVAPDPVLQGMSEFFYTRDGKPVRVALAPRHELGLTLQDIVQRTPHRPGKVGIIYYLGSLKDPPPDLKGPRFSCRRYGALYERLTTYGCVEHR